MSYKKSELVSAALANIGIADYEFDISPEEVTTGVRILEAMIAQWASKGVHIGYPISTPSEGFDIDSDSKIPDFAYEAVIYNLTIRIAPTYGKQVPMEVLITAKKALNTLFGLSVQPKERQPSNLPKGAGSRRV